MKRRLHTKDWVRIAAIALVVLVILPGLLQFYVQALWFGTVGQGSVFFTIWKYKALLCLVYFLVTFGIFQFFGISLERAYLPFDLPDIRWRFEGRMMNLEVAATMRRLRWLVASVWSVCGAFSVAADWQQWMVFFHQPSNSSSDPLFGKPLAFYFFSFPVFSFVSSWLLNICFLCLVFTLLWALCAYMARMPKRRFEQVRSVSFYWCGTTLAATFAGLAWRVWLSRFTLVWHGSGIFTGAGYTEVNAVLPLMNAMVALLLGGAASLVFNALRVRSLRWIAVVVALPPLFYFASVGWVRYVSKFQVQANEMEVQAPFITRNMMATRAAFDIEDVVLHPLNATYDAAALGTPEAEEALGNVPLWDKQALQNWLQKNQAGGAYYAFSNVDVDRYQIDGKMRQVMIAVREADPSLLPQKSWINERLVYTHGSGVAVATANDIEAGGRPKLLVKDVPPIASAPELRVTRPEIFFGEKTTNPAYVLTHLENNSQASTADGQETPYEGQGGIQLGNPLKRFLIAMALGDADRIPFSNAVTGETRVLLHRQILERAHTLAPFLHFDDDPYPVINKGRIVWMLDGYTVSDSYPYSTLYDFGLGWVNYARGSVKVTVDAYDGSIHLYVLDETDPIIAAWREALPSLFEDAADMPPGLRRHVRYPQRLMELQAKVYSQYKVEDAPSFYKLSGAWDVATVKKMIPDPMGMQTAMPPVGQNVSYSKPEAFFDVDPCYLTVPLEKENEFVLAQPFIPEANDQVGTLSGWMAARSDGANYGKLWAYSFSPPASECSPQGVRSKWENAQVGTHFKPGDSITLPLGKTLLVILPVLLDSSDSVTKYVALKTPEQFVYAPTFAEALKKLDDTPANIVKPTLPSGSKHSLAEQAARELKEYEELTSKGKHGDAGRKLDDLKSTLERLRRE